MSVDQDNVRRDDVREDDVRRDDVRQGDVDYGGAGSGGIAAHYERSSLRLPLRPRLTARLCALGAAALLLADAVFQVGLAAGAPWGAAAWGGQHVHLPAGLRAASAVSVVVLVALATAVLRYGGWRTPVAPPVGWLRPTVFAVTAFAFLNTLANLASRSSTERTIMAPATVALALLCGTLVVVGPRSRSRQDVAAEAEH